MAVFSHEYDYNERRVGSALDRFDRWDRDFDLRTKMIGLRVRMVNLPVDLKDRHRQIFERCWRAAKEIP